MEKTNEMVEIEFNQKKLIVKKNTTLAAALWNKGIKAVNYNPKSNSPRGLYCGIGRCQSCLVTINGQLYRSCLTKVKEGMEVQEVSHGK